MSLSAVAYSGVTARLLDMRKQLDVLQQQLGTGQRSTNYRDLGANRSISLDARGRLSAITAFQQNISTVDLRLNIVQTSLSRFTSLATSQRSENLGSLTLQSQDQQSVAQTNALQRLNEMFSLMNQDINGRRLFSGRATDQNATLPTDTIINGTTGLAGLSAVVEERRRADTGLGNLGRLTIDAATPGTVNLSETSGVAFGFKIAGVSSDLANVSATLNSSPANIDVTFTGLPVEGQKLNITLNLPDGTSTVVTLKASANATTSDEFTIGADANATAANFSAALSTKLQEVASTKLRVASAIKASDDFFNVSATQAPQRVNITTIPEEATSLRDGDAYGPANLVATNQAEILGNSGNGAPIVAADSTLYSFTVDTGSGPQLVSYTSGLGATQSSIVAGLIADFNTNVPGAGVTVEAVPNDTGDGIRVRALNADTDLTIGAGAGNSGLTAAAYPSTSLFDRVTAAGGASGNTLNISVNGGPNQTITFGTGGGQVSTLAELNAALGGLTGVTASISGTNLSFSVPGTASENSITVTGSSAGLRTALGITSVSGVPQHGAIPTVVWYQGDDAVDNPRSTSTVRADTSLTLGYGMRATETGFREIISSLAVFATVTFDTSDTLRNQAYSDLSAKVRDNLGQTDGQSVANIQSELASVQVSLKSATERHRSIYAYFENVVDDVESISKEEVASRILELQTRLEASYQVTSNLANLSLVNFL